MENDRARAAKQSFALRSAHRLFLAGTHRPRASVFHPPPYRCSQSYTLSDSLLSQERAFHICGKPQSPVLLFTELFHVNHLPSRFRNVFTLNSQYIFQQRLPANPLFSEKSAFNFSDRAAPAISFRARFFFDGKTRFLHRFVISRLKINDILICTLMMGEVCHVPNEIQPP